ncbi:predicted protein [Listeria monocytogenes FSL N1-017]|nr:predicted protein [Listeria monocytogenes FSL N1-017]
MTVINSRFTANVQNVYKPLNSKRSEFRAFFILCVMFTVISYLFLILDTFYR